MMGDDQRERSLMVDSINSQEYMRQSESSNYMYGGGEYNNTQQLIDSCLSSAGISAI